MHQRRGVVRRRDLGLSDTLDADVRPLCVGRDIAGVGTAFDVTIGNMPGAVRRGEALTLANAVRRAIGALDRADFFAAIVRDGERFAALPLEVAPRVALFFAGERLAAPFRGSGLRAAALRVITAERDDARLAAAFLTGAFLAEAFLAGAFLAGAFFTGAFLAGAFFAGAFFTAAFTATLLAPALPATDLLRAVVFFAAADFDGVLRTAVFFDLPFVVFFILSILPLLRRSQSLGMFITNNNGA